ncbi:MAG: hypothetical protein MUP81_00280 [Dehalococcoidia bacterium]|nr:hypothetical protein [Dehalococcoidia bacterium]
MKLDVKVELNLKIKEATAQVLKAAREAMRDTVIDVTHDAVEGSPVLTGNNRRSIMGEASGFGGGQVVDQSKIEGAVFSTSGYGGFLETGTRKMAARPYFKPAADRNVPKFPQRMKEHLQ